MHLIAEKATIVVRFLAWLANELNKWTALMLFASLPFYYNYFTQGALILFLGSWAFDVVLNQRWREVRWADREQRLMMLIWGALLAYYLLDLLYYPIEQEREFWPIIVGQQRLSYVGFAIAGFVGLQRRYPLKPFLITGLLLVYGTLLSVLFIFEGWDVFMDPGGGWTHYIFERQQHISPHMVYNLFCNTVLLMLFYQMRQESHRSKRIGWLLVGLPIYLVICISDGRIGMIGAQLVVLAGVCRLMQVKKRYFFAAMAIFTTLAAVLISIHPKFDHKTLTSQETNPRLLIWHLSAESIRHQAWYGCGSSSAAVQMRELMLSHEDEMSYDPHIAKALREEANVCTHPHNALLQAMMEHGIGGVVLMMIVLLVPFIIALRSPAPLLATAFWMCVNLQLLTEPIHSAFSEVTFCAYLILFLHLCRQQHLTWPPSRS